VGRIRDAGIGPGGRPGNYLSHFASLDACTFTSAGGDPLTIADAAELAAAPATSPERLPARSVELRSGRPPNPPEGLTAAHWEEILSTLVDPKQAPLLLVGPSPRSAAILRAIPGAVDPELRPAATFATHFTRGCAPSASRFRLVTIDIRSEGPPAGPELRLLDLEAPPPAIANRTAYVAWLAEALAGSRSGEVDAFNSALQALRMGAQAPVSEEPGLLAALCERAGPASTPVLVGQAARIAAALPRMSEPRAVAAALLEQGGPDSILGNAPEERAVAALAALKAATHAKEWTLWHRTWKQDPRVAAAARPAWMFWKR
jgi:hypothetical protein